jgi:hypothetical protein
MANGSPLETRYSVMRFRASDYISSQDNVFESKKVIFLLPLFEGADTTLKDMTNMLPNA